MRIRVRARLQPGLVTGGAELSRAGGCWPTADTVSSPTTTRWNPAGVGSATLSAAVTSIGLIAKEQY